MQCDKCGYDTKVLESRRNEKRNTVRRRRECLSCSRRFTTYELTAVFLAKNGMKGIWDANPAEEAK